MTLPGVLAEKIPAMQGKYYKKNEASMSISKGEDSFIPEDVHEHGYQMSVGMAVPIFTGIVAPNLNLPEVISGDESRSISNCTVQQTKIDGVVVALAIMIWITAIFFTVFVRLLAENLRDHIIK